MVERSDAVLDDVFAALADPTRRAVLDRLRDGGARVTDVAAAFPISLAAVSKHIRVLEAAGLVRREVRGREHVLTLDATPLAAGGAWLGGYEAFWRTRADALARHVEQRAFAAGDAADAAGGRAP